MHAVHLSPTDVLTTLDMTSINRYIIAETYKLIYHHQIRLMSTDMAKGYFHVSSHGLETNDIFKSRQDFIRGMNDIALSVLEYDVCILAFCLMSNHFHFVLYGTLEECRRFAEEYKRRCGLKFRFNESAENTPNIFRRNKPISIGKH